MTNSLPPFLPFFAAALLVPLVRGHARTALLLGVPLLGGLHVWEIPEGAFWSVSVLGYELQVLHMDRLARLFGILFHLAAFIAFLFSLHVRDTGQHVASLLYAGSALGAVFAGDFLTLFIFWELLAVSSVFLIWARRSAHSFGTGFRYLVIQVLSGVLLLAGTLIHFQTTGSLALMTLRLGDPGAWLIFLAFGIKAAFPFLHNWLTDGYPEATPTGTVFLSAFTTKVAIYSLARCFPGTEVLIYIGTLMTCFPIFYAVIENDLRRVLAYSMINQLGFMVCGIGLGTELALNGAVSHAFNDVIFKGLLFMSMGAVLHMTGRINGSELGGLYKTMPITTGLCIVGALSISAFPLFSGFVSKSMVMTAALEQGYEWTWIFLLFASAGVFHHAGIKIPFFAFFAHDSGIRVHDPPPNMLLAMGLAAGLCIGIGTYPWWLYGLLPMPVSYHPYDLTHVIAQVQLLFFSALAFCWLKLSGLYPPELPSVNLDAEWVYRKLGPNMAAWAQTASQTAADHITSTFTRWIHAMSGPFSHGQELFVRFAKTWPTGSMVQWAVGLLCLILLSYYLT